MIIGAVNGMNMCLLSPLPYFKKTRSNTTDISGRKYRSVCNLRETLDDHNWLHIVMNEPRRISEIPSQLFFVFAIMTRHSPGNISQHHSMLALGDVKKVWVVKRGSNG